MYKHILTLVKIAILENVEANYYEMSTLYHVDHLDAGNSCNYLEVLYLKKASWLWRRGRFKF